MAKKNIAASFVIKGVNIAIGLLIIPLTINYLDVTRYGIWITLSSLIAWFGFFDIGLGQGLRNRFAEALAREEHDKAKVFVSTTYAIVTMVVTIVICFFSLLNQFLNWNKILNVDTSVVSSKELSLLAMIVFVLFCLGLVLKLITTILTADQKPALSSIFDLIGKFLALVVIFIMTKTTTGSLLYFGTVYSVMPILVLVVSSLWFYNGRYKKYKPSIRYVDLNQASNLLNLGVKFFVIQITGVLFYQTNAIIIAHMFSPSEVTVYSVTYQYFGIFASVFSIILTPYWSAFTDAFTKQEFSWIKKHVLNLKRISIVMIIIVIIAVALIKKAFNIWLTEEVRVDFLLAIAISIFVGVSMINSVNCQFINGTGKVKLQLYMAITFSILHIPLAIFFCSKIGVGGIMVSAIINSFTTLVVYELQYQKIISFTARGIWDE